MNTARRLTDKQTGGQTWKGRTGDLDRELAPGSSSRVCLGGGRMWEHGWLPESECVCFPKTLTDLPQKGLRSPSPPHAWLAVSANVTDSPRCGCDRQDTWTPTCTSSFHFAANVSPVTNGPGAPRDGPLGHWGWPESRSPLGRLCHRHAEGS